MKPRRFDFSASEWLEGTLELSDADKGTLITICALIWARGGRITIDLLKDISKSHGNAVLASIDRLEKAGKIIRNGQEIGQKRAEEELDRAEKRVEKASENASKRWNNKDIVDADAFESGNPNLQPSTTNHQPSEEIPPKMPPKGQLAEEPPEFAEWWNEYPHKIGRKAALQKYRIALKVATPAELLFALRKYVRIKPPDRAWCNPATWLNQERWLDEPQEIIRPNGQQHKQTPVENMLEGFFGAVAAREASRH